MSVDLPTQPPAGWTRTQLGTLGAWSSGGTPSKARADYWLGTIPWVSPKDMKRFVLDDAEDHVSDAAATSGTRLVPAGSVFIVVRGMILAHTFPVCVAARAMAFNQDVKAIVPNGTTDGRFVAHWLSGRSDALLRLVTEATHGTKRLEQAELKAFGLDLPPVPEQRQIVAILDTIDDAIRKTEQIIAKLKQVKHGLRHDLLTRGIDDNGELRDPERHPEQFKDSPLGRLPTAWEVVPIGAAGDLRLGKQKSQDAPRSDQTRPYLRVVNIFDDRLDLRDVNEMTFSPSEFERYRLEPGDILLTEGDLASAQNVGRTAIFRGEVENCGFQNSLLRFRLSDRQVPAFFHFAFCHLRNLGLFASATMSTTVFHLSVGRLRPLPIMRPPPAEQMEISTRLNVLEESIDCERMTVSKLVPLKVGIMEDLLTGRVRVTNLLESAVP